MANNDTLCYNTNQRAHTHVHTRKHASYTLTYTKLQRKYTVAGTFARLQTNH